MERHFHFFRKMLAKHWMTALLLCFSMLVAIFILVITFANVTVDSPLFLSLEYESFHPIVVDTDFSDLATPYEYLESIEGSDVSFALVDGASTRGTTYIFFGDLSILDPVFADIQEPVALVPPSSSEDRFNYAGRTFPSMTVNTEALFAKLPYNPGEEQPTVILDPAGSFQDWVPERSAWGLSELLSGLRIRASNTALIDDVVRSSREWPLELRAADWDGLTEKGFLLLNQYTLIFLALLFIIICLYFIGYGMISEMRLQMTLHIIYGAHARSVQGQAQLIVGLIVILSWLANRYIYGMMRSDDELLRDMNQLSALYHLIAGLAMSVTIFGVSRRWNINATLRADALTKKLN